MCGICGKVNFEKNAGLEPALIRAMIDTIGYRGPDVDTDENVAEKGVAFEEQERPDQDFL
jgi:asparagine synthetase B (glutamine-hydrolysing)